MHGDRIVSMFQSLTLRNVINFQPLKPTWLFNHEPRRSDSSARALKFFPYNGKFNSLMKTLARSVRLFSTERLISVRINFKRELVERAELWSCFRWTGMELEMWAGLSRLDRRAGGGLDSLPVDPIKKQGARAWGLRNTGAKHALSELNRNLLN